MKAAESGPSFYALSISPSIIPSAFLDTAHRTMYLIPKEKKERNEKKKRGNAANSH